MSDSNKENKNLNTNNADATDTNGLSVLERMRSKASLSPSGFSKDMTLSEFAEYWLDNLTGNLKVNTRNSYQSIVKNHISRVFLSMKLNEIKPEDVQLFILSLVEGVDLDDPLSPKTITNIHGVLHKCFQAAYDLRIISENPAAKSVLPKLVKQEIIPMDNEQLKLFMRVIIGNPLEVFFKLAVFTGIRKSELMGLTWDCFNFKEGFIRVYRQLSYDKTKKRYFFDTVKNKKPRVLYPASDVMEMMHQYYQTHYNRNAHPAYVFTGLTGGAHLIISQIRDNFEKVMENMNMPDFRFHDFRHTYAVLSIKAGVDLKTLSAAMGHHSVAFTLDTYAFALTDMKQEAAKRFQSFMDDLNIKL